MPYIDENGRNRLNPSIDSVQPETAGELNYTLTRICYAWFKRAGHNYLNIAIVIGTFFCAALEFYRRVAAPYENEKIATHGDVY